MRKLKAVIITIVNTDPTLTPSHLVDALDTLGIPFLRGGSGTTLSIEPHLLLASLAQSEEARLRVALIPLLLAHPAYSVYALAALQQLPPSAVITLRCYYTAAYWLQAKYRTRITACLGVTQFLPNLFAAELGLLPSNAPDDALRALAARQQTLSGRILNWVGTYEHTVQSWLRFVEQRNKSLMFNNIV